MAQRGKISVIVDFHEVLNCDRNNINDLTPSKDSLLNSFVTKS